MAARDFAREGMVERQLMRRGISDRRVLAAMNAVPREAFVDAGLEEFAYEDAPLPIGEEQTISQPFIVALMAERAAIGPDDTVLEIGTGSGYGAAVLGRLAARVYTIERHSSLAVEAARRLARLGFDNIEVRHGDGAAGWPEAGPFDAIVVTAAAAEVPRALKEQLDIGGRLVVPLGKADEQRLMLLTRRSESEFDERDCGGVRFVPFVTDEPVAGGKDAPAIQRPLPAAQSLSRRIAEAAEPLPDFDDPAFGRLFDRFGTRKVVLLGEASHGTSEFYRARAAITRRLVEEHGFSVVAVEADWPDAAAIDRYVRHRPSAAERPAFRRFPTWMWRNVEMLEFTRWMRGHNARVGPSRQARFHGLDLYSLRASIDAVLAYLDETDPEAAAVARERYGCLTPWQNEPSTYGRAVLTAGYRHCEDAVARQCRDLLERQLADGRADGEALFDAVHNARLVAAAEKYYRTMYYADASSWNLRDRHMFETLEQILARPDPNARAVVWAHNSHIGDARETDMGQVRGEINIGQLCRERFGDDCALIGMGTHSGKVAAADDWGGPMKLMEIRPSLDGSYERLFHDSGRDRFLVEFGGRRDLDAALAEPLLERYIGVIYRPQTERYSHYGQASLARQYDAFLWFDRTSAVTPIAAEHVETGVPDTFPFGL